MTELHHQEESNKSRPKWGDQWNTSDMLYLHWQGAERCIAEALRTLPNSPCLVLGAGGGGDVERIQELLDFVVGIDISRSSFNMPGHHCLNLIQADAEILPFRNDCFGSVFCKSTLHHLPRPRVGLVEMERVMHRGGRLVLEEPGLLNPIGLIARKFFPTQSHTPTERPFLLANLDRMVSKLFAVDKERSFYLFSVGLPVAYKYINLGMKLKLWTLVAIFRLDERLMQTVLRSLALQFVIICQKHGFHQSSIPPIRAERGGLA